MQDFTDEKIQCGRCRSIKCICGIAGDPATDGLPLAETAQPLFEQRAGRSLAEVTATFGERGAQYGDTWRNCQWTIMKAVADTLKDRGVNIPAACYRVLAVAAFKDMKYQRHEGGYKHDSVIDDIAYSAFLADEVRELKEGGK